MNPASSTESIASDTSLALQMRHPTCGQSVQASLGYSWRVLLLGPIELVRRGDWRLVAVSLLLPILGQILLAPTANRSYLQWLVRRGFRAVSAHPGQVSRIEWALGIQLPRYTGRSSRSAD